VEDIQICDLFKMLFPNFSILVFFDFVTLYKTNNFNDLISKDKPWGNFWGCFDINFLDDEKTYTYNFLKKYYKNYKIKLVDGTVLTLFEYWKFELEKLGINDDKDKEKRRQRYLNLVNKLLED